MTDIAGMLDELQRRAHKEPQLKRKLLATRKEKDPVSAFCRTCRELGYEIYEMELICAGEEFYASMKRSTNGGGENSPMLDGEDDFMNCFCRTGTIERVPLAELLFQVNLEEQRKQNGHYTAYADGKTAHGPFRFSDFNCLGGSHRMTAGSDADSGSHSVCDMKEPDKEGGKNTSKSSGDNNSYDSDGDHAGNCWEILTAIGVVTDFGIRRR